MFPTTANIGAVQGVKGIVYGKSGVGKTMLAATAPNTLIIATEPGLLSLSGFNVPFWYCTTVRDLYAAADWIARAPEARQFETFLFDSITEVMELILADERPKAGKEPRRAYGELLNHGLELMKKFRDLSGPNIIFTAKETREKDEQTGALIYQPDFPGKQLGIAAPYLFDFVFRMFVYIDPATRQSSRWLLTQPDGSHEAKDRSGRLNATEPPDLGKLFNKVNGRV